MHALRVRISSQTFFSTKIFLCLIFWFTTVTVFLLYILNNCIVKQLLYLLPSPLESIFIFFKNAGVFSVLAYAYFSEHVVTGSKKKETSRELYASSLKMPEDDLCIYQMDLICRFWKAAIWLKIRDLFYLQATTRSEEGAAEWRVKSLHLLKRLKLQDMPQITSRKVLRSAK